MNITEFINQFAETHEIQNIDDLCGTIIAPITKDIYLVNIKEVEI